MVQGNPETALVEPNTIVLTASLAEKIFGSEDPMGKMLVHQNQETFTVTGVIDDVPANAHFTFSYISSIRSDENYVRNLERNSWNNNSWFTYFVLQEDVSQDQLQAKMPAFAQKYLADDEDDPDELNQYTVQALKSIHLYSHVNFEMSANNDIKYIYLFMAIALVILLIACVNYMNLATARSITRAKEVGMRKLVAVAFVLATPLAYFAMNRWLEDFAYRVDISWPIFLMAGLAALLVSWLSVGYQSMKAARVNPIESLRYE